MRPTKVRLIHAFNQARDAEQPEIAPLLRESLISTFHHAIRVGLPEVHPNPGPRTCTAQPSGRALLELSRDREGDVLRFATDIRFWRMNNISGCSLRPTKTQQKISGQLTAPRYNTWIWSRRGGWPAGRGLVDCHGQW